MPSSIRRRAALTAALLAGPLALSGCGGSSSGSSTAHIRSVDAAPNTGTSNIIINGEAPAGDQQYFAYSGTSSQPASPYYYIQPQNGTSFTYIAGVGLASGSSAGTNNFNVNSDQYYTAFLIGRPDTYNSSCPDPRFLQVVLAGPRAGGTSGQATLRVLNAAPDAGFTTTTVNGAVTAYHPGSLTVTIGSGAGAVPFSGVGYATASNYQTLPTGTNVPVTVAVTGGATIETGTVNLSGNSVSTLVVAEPTVPNGATAAAYDLHLLSD